MPPGPGPQTRAIRRRLLLRELGFCGLGLFIVVGSVFVYADRDPQQPVGKGLALAAIPLPFAAGMFFAAWWFWRSSPRLRRTKNLEVGLDRQELRRGDSVNVTLNVHDPAKVRGELQLGVVFVERYDEKWGSTPRGTYRVTREKPVKEDWQPARSGSTSLTIPHEGECSYEGECISYAWRICARDHRGGRRDPQTDATIWVSP